ncbi:MAG TPA: FAD-dependent oxidoreductase [Pyrinomonadaceae bacterium]|nr:FAD-dependent oxidoreductase [Pyrinomonadaceae bacterium]
MKLSELDRRKFLRGAVAAGVGFGSLKVAYGSALATGDLSKIYQAAHYLSAQVPPRALAHVKVARNRIIRTVVGLRPFRSEGFVVGAERLGEKLLIHNYGHGGAGVTLSWGTASLAADIARDFIQTGIITQPVPIAPEVSPKKPLRRLRLRAPVRFAVIGCGVSGLSTARLIQQRLQNENTTVTIYAKELPPHTTSNVAGALWSPTSVYDSDAITAGFREQFRQAARISNRAFQELVGPEYGVRWTDAFELLRSESSPQRELTGGNDLYAQVEIHRDPKRYFGFPLARQFSTMVIEPHTYLRALMRDFYLAGGKIVVREFRNRSDIARLREQIIFNCTGLGSRTLLNDELLYPVRGQLEILLPQPEVDYCYLAGGAYMFPRRDGIVLGGTWDREDWSLEPDADQTNQILASHEAVMKGGEK